MPIRAFSALSGLAPTVDGQPALIGPYDRPDDTVVPTIRTLGWRKTRNENVPIVHAKLALLGHLWWHDEDGLGMVTDVIGFSARRLWISSANFTRSSRHSLEFGFWTEEQSLLAGAERFLVQLMSSSEGVDPESDAFRPDLAPYEFDDEAMAEALADFDWDAEDEVEHRRLGPQFESACGSRSHSRSKPPIQAAISPQTLPLRLRPVTERSSVRSALAPTLQGLIAEPGSVSRGSELHCLRRSRQPDSVDVEKGPRSPDYVSGARALSEQSA
jgi:hypothetical protein